MSDKTIVITRPKGDGAILSDALHAQGYRVIHEPLTEIMLHHTQRHALEHALMNEPDAVIVTSRHGVQALALLTELRDLYLLCVGEATAHVAYSMGFDRVAIGGGNAQSLVHTILASYDKGSRFLYVSADQVRTSIDTILTAQGMHAQRLMVYEAVAAEQFSDIFIEQLKRKQLDAVTFMSQRSTHIFTALADKANVETTLSHLDAICLSKAVTAPLRSRLWKGVHVANEATLASLVECVDNVFSAK